MSTVPVRTAIPKTAPTSAQDRRQVALAVAQQCIQVLKQEFSADDVIIFGSLRGDGPWHDQSDLDLAVQGLSSSDVWDARLQLKNIVPDWLPFDLIAVERADERVRDHILQTTPVPENKHLFLKLRLEDELAQINQVVDALEEVLTQVGVALPILLTPALASYVESFYSGCEKIAQRVAVNLDGNLPKREAWHKELLLQLSALGGENRPPVWDKSLLQALNEYRSFRHRVRYLYSIELDDDRVLELAQQVPAVSEKLTQAIEVFGEWLVEQSEATGDR